MKTLGVVLKHSLNIPVDFAFIKEVVNGTYKIAMLDYESFTEKTTLKHIFKHGRDCVAILFHIKDVITGRVTPIGHWTLLIKPSKANKQRYQFFDSLGMGLKKILLRTHESPHLWNLLRHKKWDDSTQALQTQGKHFKECGSFVGVRGRLGGLTNKEFVRFIRNGSRKADKNVVMLTLLTYIKHYKM